MEGIKLAILSSIVVAKDNMDAIVRPACPAPVKSHDDVLGILCIVFMSGDVNVDTGGYVKSVIFLEECIYFLRLFGQV